MSPYRMSGSTVVSFSGGRTSAYMLRQVLDNNDDMGDLIVTFANTGKEHPATLDFVKECSERWAVPIVWLEFRDNEQGFAIVNYDRPSYQQMLDYSDTQFDMFVDHEEAIACFCGD